MRGDKATVCKACVVSRVRGKGGLETSKKKRVESERAGEQSAESVLERVGKAKRQRGASSEWKRKAAGIRDRKGDVCGRRRRAMSGPGGERRGGG